MTYHDPVESTGDPAEILDGCMYETLANGCTGAFALALGLFVTVTGYGIFWNITGGSEREQAIDRARTEGSAVLVGSVIVGDKLSEDIESVLSGLG